MVGSTFPARISGVARFGLFARLNETGADGIIPIHSLPDDHYFHDEKRQALVGKRTRKTYQLAQPVIVRLEQADKLTGGMSFSLVEAEDSENKPKKPIPHGSRKQSTGAPPHNDNPKKRKHRSFRDKNQKREKPRK